MPETRGAKVNRNQRLLLSDWLLTIAQPEVEATQQKDKFRALEVQEMVLTKLYDSYGWGK